MTWGDACVVRICLIGTILIITDCRYFWAGSKWAEKRRESCRMCFWMVKCVSCSTPLVKTNISHQVQGRTAPHVSQRGTLSDFMASFLPIHPSQRNMIIDFFLCVCVCPGWHVVKSELKQLLDFSKKNPTSVLVPGCQRLLRQSFSTVSVGSKALSVPERSNKPWDAKCCGRLRGNIKTTKINFNDLGYNNPSTSWDVSRERESNSKK